MQKLPSRYKQTSSGWTYKGFPVVAFSTCWNNPDHGNYPSVYKTPDGRLHEIDGKKCPYCRSLELFQEEMNRAFIPPRFISKSLENYETKTQWQKEAKATIQNYIDHLDENLTTGRNIIMIGSVGTGKTHLSISLLKAVIDNGGLGMFTTAGDIFMNIRNTWQANSDKSTLDVTQRFCDMDFLVIDEIGVQRGTDNEREILFSILNERYNYFRPTVLLSNLPIDGVRGYIGERIYDRLKENGGLLITLNGQSYRK